MLSISNYHYIREDFDAPYPSIYGVTPHFFKNQLGLLKNQAEGITPKDLLENTEFVLNSKSQYFLITFDDGLKEQFHYALSILDELDLSALFFVNSSVYVEKKVSTVHKIHLLRSILSPNQFLQHLANSNFFSFSEADKYAAQKVYVYDTAESAQLKYFLNFIIDFKTQESIIASLFNSFFDEETILDSLYMSKNQIITLSKHSFLGSHTHHHYPIGLLEKNEMQRELQESKNYLELLTESKIETVSYPYGTPEVCTETVATIAKQIGYKIGFTAIRGINTLSNNPLLLHRLDCNDVVGGKNYKSI